MNSADARITRVEVYGYDLTYAHGEYAFSGGRSVSVLPSTVVRVVTADGAEGFGELCPLGSQYLPAFSGGARAALAELGPALIGVDACNLAMVNAVMNTALAGHPYAKSPLDIACWDVLGKVSGLPVASLLGGVLQESFPLYTAVPLASPSEMSTYISARKAEGFGIFQLKVGEEVVEDVARVRSALEAADPGDEIVVDANGGWDLRGAAVALNMLAPLGQLTIEQPCASLEGCLAVRRFSPFPLILDESIVDVSTLLRAHGAGALEGINLKISRVGGLTQAKLIRDLAVSLGLQVTIEDAWGGDLTTAVVSHLSASTPRASFFAASFMNDWNKEHIGGHVPRATNAVGSAPRGPGLGSEVDLDILGRPLMTFV